MKPRFIAVIAGAAAVTTGLIGGVAVSPDTSVAAPRAPIGATVTATSPLSSTEATALVYMREEEKVARDVYLTLAKQYPLSVFSNIAKSENTHMTAVKTLLDRYGVQDPVGSNAVGVFQNDDLQALYDQLVAQGSTSLTAALEVGVLIEETDIDDLEQHLSETTHADVKTVYTNLLKGSYNHLSSFERLLARYGG